MNQKDAFLSFLLRAKQNTYASGAAPGLPSRIHSHDLRYQEGNFLYLDTKQPSSEIAERFQARGIIIRDCRSFRGAGENHVRVTVGTPSENDRFLSAFMEICE